MKHLLTVNILMILTLAVTDLLAADPESMIRIIGNDIPSIDKETKESSTPQFFKVQNSGEDTEVRAGQNQNETEAAATASQNGQEEQSKATVSPGSPPQNGNAPGVTQKKKISIAAPLSGDTILLESAINLYGSEEYRASISKVDELLELHSSSSLVDQAYIWKAKGHLKLGEPDKALTSAESVDERSGEFPEALYLSGQIYLAMKETDSAKESYFEALSLFPSHELADDSLLALAEIHLEEQKGDLALKAVVRILKEYPDRETSDDAFYMMGKIYEKDPKHKDIERARIIYRKFIAKSESEPDSAFAHSPLLTRVKNDLEYIEREYFSAK